MRTFLAIVVALALGACGEKKDETKPAESKPAAGGEKKGAAPKEPAPPPAPSVIKYASGEEFWKDYTGTPNEQIMDKFMGKKVEITGTLTQVVDADPEYFVWIDAGNNKRIDTKFKDPAAAKAKGKKKGDTATIVCDIGGMDDNAIYVIDCELK